PGRRKLLHALLDAFRSHERIEDGQHVPPVLHDSRENILQLRLALRFPVPLGEHRWRHFDVPAQLLGGVAAQEESIEKRRFPLRKVKIARGICGNELYRGGHGESAVYRTASTRQVVPSTFRRVPANPFP